MNDIFILPLTNSSQLCLVDAGMVEDINQKKWYLEKSGYIRAIADEYGDKPFLHNYLLGFGFDHINHLKWDNREINFRKATSNQNNRNASKAKNCSSKYKGVSWFERTKKWRAVLYKKGKFIQLGYFELEEDAARAYNNAAIEHFGEFACINSL